MDIKKKLSIILPCYDQHEITKVHLIEAMNANRTPDEVIIVNDGGDPCLRNMLKEIPNKKCKVIYSRIEQDILWNYNGAVNLGTWLSRGDYLAFEDNDNIPNRTWYQEAIDKFEEYPEVGRITANKRERITKWQAISVSSKNWKPQKGGIGPNMGTNMIRRDIVLKLKGQDERFSGGYGWMFVDWRFRMLNRAKTKFGSVGFYWYVMNAQSNLPRNKRSSNLSVRKENCRTDRKHSNYPMLNFTYTYEEL